MRTFLIGFILIVPWPFLPLPVNIGNLACALLLIIGGALAVLQDIRELRSD